MKQLLLFSFACGLLSCTPETENDKIDRKALVTRHTVQLTAVDTLGSLSIGNGEFAFTADVTGLQSFPEVYENGVSLGTQSQWGWHTFPSDSGFTLRDVDVMYETCNDREVPYPIQHREGRPANATHWLRANPHRLHLGVTGLTLLLESGEEARISDLKNIRQELDLWTGRLESSFEVEGNPVHVITYAHQEKDQVSFRVESPLIRMGRLKVKLQYPTGKECHTCAGYDFSNPGQHTSNLVAQEGNSATIARTLDSTRYFVQLTWSHPADLAQQEPHHWNITPNSESETFECSIHFTPERPQNAVLATFAETKDNSETRWEDFWQSGGVIDFSESTDKRAHELERRVVLSQYLTKIQCAGSMPPQETGLTFNSWFGKFHLEMHWWHGTHFALWNRSHLLEKSLGWYSDVKAKAKATAEKQGYRGARWQKMTDPNGNESPSGIGAFIIWQQPHFIYFAELLYRENPSPEILEKYKDLVFETAEFMASFAQFKEEDGYYHLCRPIVPAQEIFRAAETDDPAFEVQYWHYGLSVAQEWRKRLGMEANTEWQKVIDGLRPLTVQDDKYLPTATSTEAYSNFDYRHDHPIVTGIMGILPNSDRVNPEIMANTFDEIMNDWHWQSTWGWDYPMLAMCAARLGKGDQAVNALLLDVQKNTYLVNGHNYQDGRLRIYLPGNGGLLAAVATMAAGWDGAPERLNPGFPDDGTWKVKWEGLAKMP